jgi:TonB family protein
LIFAVKLGSPRVSHPASAIVCVMVASQLVCAQTLVAVDSRALNEHVISKVPLTYPAIAKAAQVEGKVVLQISVDSDGKVTSTRTISGPPMLVQAAVDCVKAWRYRPFEENGVNVPVTGTVSLVFTLGDKSQSPSSADKNEGTVAKTTTVTLKGNGSASQPDDPVAAKYYPLWDECTRGVIAHKNDGDTASICKQAADVADDFPRDQRFIEKRSAFVYASIAFANVGDLKQAQVYAEKAVAEVKLGHDDDSGDNAAYSVSGHIHAFLGNLAEADQDLTVAEDNERKAVLWAQKNSPGIVQNYQHVLQSDLRFHAEVLKRMNRSVDAQTKLDEAAKL